MFASSVDYSKSKTSNIISSWEEETKLCTDCPVEKGNLTRQMRALSIPWFTSSCVSNPRMKDRLLAFVQIRTLLEVQLMSNYMDPFLIIPSMPGRERPERQWKSPLPQDRGNLEVPPPWSPDSFLYKCVLITDSFPLVLRDSPLGLGRGASTLTCSLPCIKQNYDLQLFLRPCGFFQRLGDSALLLSKPVSNIVTFWICLIHHREWRVSLCLGT